MTIRFFATLSLGVLALSGAARADLLDPDSRGCAAPVKCMDAKMFSLSDSGHTLVVEFSKSNSGTKVLLEDLTYLREARTRVIRTLAELPCKKIREMRDPDAAQPMLVCEDPTIVDAGFMVELLDADFAGVHRARVVENRLAGPRELGLLPCRRM